MSEAGESLDISAYALKRLLNHKINHSDVTAGYIVTDIERLRTPMKNFTSPYQDNPQKALAYLL